MLKLTTRINESFIFQTTDGPVEVFINKVNGAQVGVSIKTPLQVSVSHKALSSRAAQKPFELY